MTSFSSFGRHAARSLLGLAALVLTVGAAGAQRDFIPLDEIRPGMTGYGLTVFEGTRIDTFGVTVIGVQEKVRADGNLLVVEVSGHGLEISSIAQGMSGSPIYLDGRFAGALAFGWGGALRPLAGVTPAAEMLALPAVPEASPVPEVRLRVPDLHGLVPPGVRTDQLARALGEEPGQGDLTPGPSVTGTTTTETTTTWPGPRDLIVDLLEQLMPADAGNLPGPERWIIEPVGAAATKASGTAGASSSDHAADQPAELSPGSACAVPLILGDARLGAIGTVTWVEGDRVLLLGHPFMQRGPVDWPLATAEVLTVFPSRQMSFKMGTIGQVVGAVHHDQRAGLAGRIGPAPDMIPVAVDLNLPPDGPDQGRTYRFHVVDDPGLTPALVFWTLYNTVLAAGDDASLQTLRYRIETTWEGNPALADEPLVLSGVVAGPGGAMGLATQWMAPLSILLNNPHETLRLKGVHARLELTRPMATASIVAVSGPRVLPEQGGEVEFQVDLRPRQGAPFSLTVPVTLPRHLPAGPYRVVAASAAELFAFEAQRAGGRFQATSLPGILDILRAGRSADTLVLALMAPGSNLVVQGREMHDLPGSVANLIRAGNMQAPKTLVDYAARRETPTDWALSGFAVRALHLKSLSEPVTEERRP